MATRSKTAQKEANQKYIESQYNDTVRTDYASSVRDTEKLTRMSDPEKRRLKDYLYRETNRELASGSSVNDINNAEKLTGILYDNTPASAKNKRKDILALSNSKYTNTLLEKILKTQNDTAFTDASLKYQQQVTASLSIIQADIKQLVEFAKPKEGPQTQAERKELEMGTSGLAKAMSTLDLRGIMKEFSTGIAKQFDSDGTGELLMSMLGMFKEQIQEGSFGNTIKDMIKEAILDRMPYGNDFRRFKDDPVGFSQQIINQLGMSQNAGIRTLFKQHIKGMKPSLTPEIKKIDMSAEAKFDNKVYTSITRIIPEQLYKMVALLSGREERKFDWEHQTYRNVSNMMAEEYQKNASKTVTYHIDNYMRDIGANVEEMAATNKDIRSMVKYGADGKVLKDSTTGMPILKNREAVRKIITNMLKSGGTLPDLIGGDPIHVIKTWKLTDGFAENSYGEAIDAVKFLKAYYLALPEGDRKDIIQEFEDSKRELDRPEISELMQGLETDQRELYESILSSRKLTKDEMITLFKTINIRGAKVDIAPLGGVSGLNSVAGGSDVIDALLKHKDARSGIDTVKDAIAKNVDKSLTDKEKDELNKFLSNLASGDTLEKVSSSKDLHNGSNDAKTALAATREQFDYLMRYMDKATIRAMETNKLGDNSNAANLSAIKTRLDNGLTLEKDSEQEKHFQKELTRLRRAIELYEAYDNAGLTANATARLLGVNPNSVKNKLRGPEDLMAFITDDGKIDQNKLKAFTASSGVDLSYINDDTSNDVMKEYQKSQRGTISGDLKGSITKTLSAIFGDPKIANKAGIAVGSAAGLGIAELLKNAGVISSPKAQYLLAAVGGGLMSMERTRKYMQNIFGPEGDIKNAQGVTNKEIFFAKAMQKYLPMAGVSGATFKYVNKAFKAFGPIGSVVGVPIALLSAAFMGAATPSIIRWGQRTLFDRDKDDKSWAAKLGRFLKDIPFVKKYFDITGIQSGAQIKLRSLDTVKSRLQEELAQTNDPEKSKVINAQIEAINKLQDRMRQDIDEGKDNDALWSEQTSSAIDKLMQDITKNVGGEDYSVIQKTDEDRRTHDNNLKASLHNSGESLTDMKYTNFYSGDTGDLHAGITQVMSYSRDSGLNKGLTVDQLYSMSDDDKKKALRQLMRDQGGNSDEFMRRYNLYKRLRDAGINVSDSSEAGADLETYLKDGLSKYIEERSENKKMLEDIKADNTNTIQSILGTEDANRLELIAREEDPAKKKRLFEEWRAKVGEEKLKEIAEIGISGAAKDALIQKLFDITEDFVEVQNFGRDDRSKLTPAEIKQRAMNIMTRSYNVDMLTKVLQSKFGDKSAEVATKIKTMLEPGNDAEDIEKHKTLMDIYNQLNGGKGSKSNVRVSMKELSDKRFRTGESLSVAGCSVAALNNTLFYLGVTTVDVDTLIEIANKHLTSDGGVNSEFFNEVSKNLGLKTTIYNNVDNTFTPDSLQEVKPSSNRGVIALLKNKDGNGNHYVTVKKIGLKNCEIDDPELNGSSTKITTGDICVRAVEIIVLDKSKENASLKKTKLQDKIDNIKNLFTRGKTLLGDVKSGNIVSTIKASAKEMWNAKVADPIKEAITQPFAKVKDSATNIVDAIINGLKDITLNTRIVEDYTLPLKMSDVEAARAVANDQAMGVAGSDVAKKANANVKKLLKNKDVVNEMSESDKVQDALMSLESIQNTNMVAGASTGAGGKGSGKTKDASGNDVPENKKQPGWLGNIIGGIVGGKVTKLATWKNLAGALALAGTSYLGWRTIGKKAAAASVDQFKRWRHNAPIIGDREEVEYEYDENGMATKGQHKDSAGSFRNLRDSTNTAKAAAMSLTAGYKGLKKVSDAGKFGSTFAKSLLTADKGIPKLVVKTLEIIDKALGWANKFGLGKLGFNLDSKLLRNGLEKFFTKMAPKLTKWLAAKEFAKKIPVVGTVVGVIQAAWSLIDAWRHHEAYTEVDPSKLTFGEKARVAIAKMLFDAGFEAAMSLYPPAAPLSLAYSVARGMGLIKFNDIKFLFGVDYNSLRAKVAERTKAENNANITPETLAKREKEYKQLKLLSGKGTADDKMREKYGELWRTQESGSAPEEQVTQDNAGKVTPNDTVKSYNSQSAAATAVQNKAMDKFNEKLDPEMIKKANAEAESNPDYQTWKKRGAGWLHPLKNRNVVVTSAYGPRNVQGGSKNHKGIDLRGDENTPVFAMKDGEVILSTQTQGEIKIKHDDGTISRYLHMSQRFMKAGDRVKAGDKIGMVGGIGSSGYPRFNAHLHLETFDKNGQYKDPFIELGLDPKVFKLGPQGRENERYLMEHAWMLDKSKEEANKLANAQKLDSNNKQPEKLGLNTEKGGESDRKTAADYQNIDKSNDKRSEDITNMISPVINMVNGNAQAIQMLAGKMDQMIQLLSTIADSTGQLSNNSMFDFNAPAVIR